MNYIDKYFNLSGKVVAITGGAGFLCSKMTSGFHHAGCKIAVLDSDLENAEKIIAFIKDEGGQAVSLKVDANKKEYFESCLKSILDHFRRVYVLINGAGINAPTPNFRYLRRGEVYGLLAGNWINVWIV